MNPVSHPPLHSVAGSWSAESICLRTATIDVPTLAQQMYTRVCRTTFAEPGFCLFNAGHALSSVQFRQLMVDLKRAMTAIHETQTGDTLIYLSASRFDQQTTTKPHLDGGPEQCFLMLGYEPSAVDAELEMCDYTKCATDLGLTPTEFLAKHNPMFRPGYELLRPYSTRIPCYSKADFQIVCINNSYAPYDPARRAWLGTLHTATILTPDEAQRRVINSTLIASAPRSSTDAVTEAQLHDFIHTSTVLRRGYDKPHLADDV